MGSEEMNADNFYKTSRKMNSDDFHTPTTIVPVPKQGRKSNLDVLREHNAEQANQGRIRGPGSFGSTGSLLDNYRRGLKNIAPKYESEVVMSKRIAKNFANNAQLDNLITKPEVNTDCFHTPTTVVPVPKQARKNNLNIFRQNNAERANQNRIDDTIDFASTTLIEDRYNGRPKNNGLKYDLDLLMHKRIISSDDVRKSTLIKRDEIVNEFSTERAVEDDETFFENLKKRITEDLQKNISKKTPDTLPKHLSKPRKIKSLFNNETRSLMNKFREEFALNRSKKLLSEDDGLFSVERRSSSRSREDFHEQPHNVVERRMTKNISKHFETDEDSLRDRSPFEEIRAEACNHQSSSSSSERSGMFSMKHRSSSWTGEAICEHTHSAMPQNVVDRRMTKDLSMKHFETDEDSLRDRSPFNDIHAEAFNDQQTPSSLERNRSVSMKRRSDCWTREDIREHAHPPMPQNVVDRRMTKDLSMKHFETDEDSLRDRSPFNESNAEAFNDPPTTSSSERNEMFSMECRRNGWTREHICDYTHPLMPQNVVERRKTNDVLCGVCEVHAGAYYRQPKASSERNGVFSMQCQNDGWTQENICEHRHPAMPQYVVERRMTNDIPMKYIEIEEESLYDRPPFKEIHTEAYNRQPILLSSGHPLDEYPTMQYYQIMQ